MDEELKIMCEAVSKYIREKYHFEVEVTITPFNYKVAFKEPTCTVKDMNRAFNRWSY